MKHRTDRRASPAAPPRETTRVHQVLVLVALYLFGIGPSGTELHERVEDAVADDDRRARATAIAERMEGSLAEHLQRIAQHREAFLQVAASYETTADEIRAALAPCVTEVELLQQTLVAERFRLVAEMNASEWEELCKGGDPLAEW